MSNDRCGDATAMNDCRAARSEHDPGVMANLTDCEPQAADAGHANSRLGIGAQATAALIEAIRAEAGAHQLDGDETPVLLQVSGRHRESTALIFAAFNVWEIARADDCVVLNTPRWAVPWVHNQSALHGYNVGVVILRRDDTAEIVATAAGLGVSKTFALFSDAIEAARLLAT